MMGINPMIFKIIGIVFFIVLAPFIGGFLEGLDRKISARMQGRVGPPIRQPFYDVKKLLSKEKVFVNKAQGFLLASYLVLMIFSGALLFGGYDMLLSVFVLSTAAAFLYFAASVTSSPYSSIGATRELIQMMAYEPAVLLTCVGFYLVRGSFNVQTIVQGPIATIIYLPGFFVAFVFIMTIKMRKSPFDISTSHHMHQEIVKGITTDMGARNMAIFQITEWYENVFLLGVVAMFFLNRNPWSILAAIIAILIVYFIEIVIDNTNARIKADHMLKLTWIVTGVTAGLNLVVLMLIRLF